MYTAQSAVLENPDLLRLIGDYLIGYQLPFILSYKAVRDALKPLNTVLGQKWIKSNKKYFVVSVTMIEWAQSFRFEISLNSWSNNLFAIAASYGSVDVLKRLHQKYPPYKHPVGVGYLVSRETAKNGHLAVLEYFRSLGSVVKWSKSVCSYAARGGHIHVLRWLREVLNPPCPWIEHTCTCAAEAGHLDVLQWLRSQESPCPWVKRSCIDKARENNHHEVVEWILSQH